MATASRAETTFTTPSDREIEMTHVVDAALATGMKDGVTLSYNRLADYLGTFQLQERR